MKPNRYSLHNSPQHRRLMTYRTASEHADFFLPFLQTGMRVLDCGCGPGSITLGFADAVNPGEVFGIDLGTLDIEMACLAAVHRGLTNVHFEIANVYDLPFPNASFDAAFAHALLQHLPDPGEALKEIRRVLKPGGVLGISDADYGTILHEPSTPLLSDFHALLCRALEFHGGSPFYARNQRHLLVQAGFARSEGRACVLGQGSGTPEKTQFAADYFQLLLNDVVRPPAMEHGWADKRTLDSIAVELERWGERSDAFYSIVTCRAIGWVQEVLHPMIRVEHDPAKREKTARALRRLPGHTQCV